MRLQKEVLYYAVNGSELYQKILMYSLNSLCFYRNKKLTQSYSVAVFVFGSVAKSLRHFCKIYGIALIERPAMAEIYNWSLKWVSLRELTGCERILFCDVDTIFFSDPAKIFGLDIQSDFLAQVEDLKGFNGRGSKLDQQKLSQLREATKSKSIPIFNSSVFVMSGDAIRQINSEISFILEIQHELIHDLKRNPVDQRWYPMIEEVAFSLSLGRSKQLKWKILDHQLIAHFRDLNRGILPTPEVVLHIGNEFVPQCLELLGCEQESKLLKKAFAVEKKSFKALA